MVGRPFYTVVAAATGVDAAAFVADAVVVVVVVVVVDERRSTVPAIRRWRAGRVSTESRDARRTCRRIRRPSLRSEISFD